MELLDSRRLTGANSISDRPGAVIDIDADDDQLDELIKAWMDNATRLLAAVGWNDEKTYVRRCAGGASLAISAPIDALYAATELNEYAWDATIGQPGGQVPSSVQSQVEKLRRLIAEERNPAVPALEAAARRHDVTFLVDDDRVSVGMGKGCQEWPVGDIPPPGEIDWSDVHDIPVGLITGTNGKTTSVRMAAGVLRAAGLATGYSTTDCVKVDDDVVKRGDFAGPEGARTILRDRRVEIAVLETARGGLLRRGVNVPRARAALLTRIARDHLGDFGSRNLTELLDVKWVVTRALGPMSRLILNADDERLVHKAPASPVPVVFFTLDSTSPVVAGHIAAGGEAWALHNDRIARWRDGGWRGVTGVSDIPLTMGGAARHNIANALGVAALCAALGVDDDAIRRGLSALESNDNPGRGNLIEIDGVRVLVDYAHNPDAFRAIVGMAQMIDAKRRLIAFGEAGDRTDELIRDLARTAWQLSPDRVITLEMAKHARGRSPGEIAQILRREFRSLGAASDQVTHHETELGALREALAWARPGDLIILFSLAEQEDVLSFLSGRS